MSNKFAIVYSAFFVKSSDRLIINRWNSNYDDVASQLSSELHYSIKTLLDYKNEECCDIYIYCNQVSSLKKIMEITQEKNNLNIDLSKINFIQMDYGTNIKESAEIKPEMCLHKWRNMLKTFELKNYEAIMWLDADTYVNTNLKYIFEKFKNSEKVPAKLESLYFKKETRFHKTLDSGVFIFTKKVFNKLNMSPNKFEQLILNKIEKLTSEAELYVDTNSVMFDWNLTNFKNWTIEQIAGEDVLRDLGIECSSELYEEGYLAAWPDQIGGMSHIKNSKCDIKLYPICHYKNFFGPIFVPKDFWHQKINKKIPLKELFDQSHMLATYGSEKIRCKKCGLPWDTINNKNKHLYLCNFPKPNKLKN